MRIRFYLCTIVLAAVTLPEAEGVILLSDSFTYPDGAVQVVSVEKWVGHSGASNQVDVRLGVLNLSGTESQDVNAPLAPLSTNSWPASLYVQFKLTATVLPSGAGSYFAHFKDETIGYRGRIWTVPSPTNSAAFRIGISSTGGTKPDAVVEQDLQIKATYSVVARLTVTNSLSALWINPRAESDTPALSTTAPPLAITAFAFRQATGIGEMTIDDLVVGTSFAEVVVAATVPGQPTIAASPPALWLATEAPRTIALRWEAETARTYSVWTAASLVGPFDLLTNGLRFTQSPAVFVDNMPPQIGSRFYRVSTP